MNIEFRSTNVFAAAVAAALLFSVAGGCKSSTSPNAPVGTAATQGAVGAAGTNTGSTATQFSSSGGTTGNNATTSGVGSGGTGASSITKCPAQKITCAGLSSCPLAICYKVSKGEMPATCSCLSGTALANCCAEVKTGMGDCLDYTNYPECAQAEKVAECPTATLQSLVANPYVGGVNGPISAECQKCLCSNCSTELSYVNKLGQPALALLQCAVATGALKDCLVCSPAPCDVTLGTNLMTGPCSQEAIAACGSKCTCGGAFDVGCISLAGCLNPTSARSLPCSAAHASAVCLASKCPACGSFPTCPSNLENFNPGGIANSGSP